MANTPFDDWLAQLRRARKGGVALLPAVRYHAFKQPLRLPGDWSGTTFRGQVRRHPDSATLLASFSFTSPVFDPETGKTLVTFSLAAGNGANSTGILDAPDDGSETAWFAFDVLATRPSEAEELLIGGTLPVIGRVTV